MAALDYGFKVSEEGFDVKTAADKNLSMKTGFTLLKVKASGAATMDANPKTVAHGLTYEPQFLAWAIYPDYPDYEGLDTVLLMTGNYDAGAAYVDTTNLNLQPSSGQGTTSDATYYIFYEPTNTGTAPSITTTSNYGIKVTKDGADISSANIFDQTFNSEKNCLKISEVETTVSTGSTDIDITVAHGLSVIPGYLVYFKVGSGKWYSCWEKEDVSGADVQVGAISETTNIYLQIR